MIYEFDGVAVSIVAKATVVLSAGLTGAWLARGCRAAVRHAVLAAVFAVLLALPIASVLSPPVRVAVSVMPSVFAETIDAAPQVASSGEHMVAEPLVPRWSLPSMTTLLIAGWFAGAVFLLLRMMIGLLRVHSLRRLGLPWREGQVLVNRLALDVGILRHADVLLHESLPAPVTCGVIHPAIVLPPDAENWGAEDLNRALVHELEHVRRGDWAIHCLARIVCEVYWFHPLVWIAWRRLTLEAERACDDVVLSGSEATVYADQLVGLARRLSTNRKSPALAMANRSDLLARVGAVLDSRQRRGRAGKMLMALACAAAVVVVVTMSPLKVVAAPQTPSAQPAVNAPAFEVASVRLNETIGRVPVKFGTDRLTLTSVDLRIGLMLAYGIRDFQLTGPDWLRDSNGGQRFDVVAKASGPVPEDQLRLMLRTLLAERFHLALHWEKRDMPVTALVIAKGGPKLHRTASGPEPDTSFLGFTNVGVHQAPGPDGRVWAAFTNAPTGAMAAALSASLRGVTDVVDMTELQGRFDFVMHEIPPPALGDPPAADDKPAFYRTMVQDDFGLTLERRKAPVDMLVVDHADKTPTEN
jgi:uncharacterized protein (TIGR03435 family)